MKYAIILMLGIAYSFSVYCQEKNIVTVNLEHATWTTGTKTKSMKFAKAKIPDVLTLILPEDDFEYYSILVGADSKEKFSISLNCSGDSCVKIRLGDIKEQKIDLQFMGGYLIGIGGRLIEKKQLPLVKDSMELVISNSKPAKPTAVQAEETPARTEQLKSVCDPEHQDQKNQKSIEDLQQAIRYHFLCYMQDTSKKEACCASTFQSPFDYRFMRPCLDKQGKAVTHKYRMVYDVSKTSTSNGSPFTLLKMKKQKNYEYYKVKKSLQPKAWKEIIFTIIGEKDSVYKVSVTSGQNYMEYEKDFFEGLQALSPKTTEGADSTTKESTGTADTTRPASIPASQKASILKQKMTDLGNDLITFNSTVFSYVDYSDEAYKLQLRCLQQNIIRILELTKVPESGQDLANELAKLILKLDIKQYHRALCSIIQSLMPLYEQALNLKSKYYVISDVIRVPNEDEINIEVKTNKGTEVLKERKFLVSGGFKIDFSTGFFHSGISTSDFIVSPQTFRFKVTKDTVLANGTDSVMYNGGIRDTSISVIRKNEKLSFGTGIYLHFYPRTGCAINAGGAAGLILDNNGQVQFLLGGSLMFNAGKNRIALVGGYARGKEKRLSAENEIYYRTENQTYFNSRNDLPKSFTGTNPATFDKWKSSWFFGVTFNFASLPSAKK